MRRNSCLSRGFWLLVACSTLFACTTPTTRPEQAPVESRGMDAAAETEQGSGVRVITPAVSSARPDLPAAVNNSEEAVAAAPQTQFTEIPEAEPATVATPAESPPNKDAPAMTTELLAQAHSAAKAADWDRAQAALERGLRHQPNDHRLWRELARTHLERGQPEVARQFARRALSLTSNDQQAARIWRLLSRIELAAGDAVAADAASAQAAALMP